MDNINNFPHTVIRPVKQDDLPSLMHLAKSVGPGMTNLPYDEAALQNKIDTSIHSFANGCESADCLGYFFVQEDLASKKIVGTSAIAPAGGHMVPFYHFKISNFKYVCKDLELENSHKVLTLVNDYQGVTEICGLYLLPEYRLHHNGSLLSRSRFLFMADHHERFDETIIAEMRGIIGKNGSPPFWDNIISKFINLSFFEADKLTGMGYKQFISDLMPRYPIYIELLPDEIQKTINKVHKDTKPAIKMLEKEGFVNNGHVDIFDVGPIIECKLNRIRSVENSKIGNVVKICSSFDDNSDDNFKLDPSNLYLISNSNLNFRACIACLKIEDSINHNKSKEKNIILSEKTAEVLKIGINSKIRYVKLRHNYK